MKLDQALVDAAINFVTNRFPDSSEEGAAAMYTEDGSILISTADHSFVNPSVTVCYETGAICEAYKLGKRIVATVCVSRDKDGIFRILTPCGVCQERLLSFGDMIETAVPIKPNSVKWEMRLLKELQPYYWYKAFSN